MATMLKASVQKLNPATTCVLVCDVQQRFTEIIFGFQELVKCSSYLVKVANALDLPVVCTEQYPKAFKQTVPELSSLIQQKEKNKMFEKTMFSMATPEVMSHLSSMGIESCVLCGLETHVCVLQTTLDLLDHGLHVHIACDAVSSQRPFDRSVALEKAGGRGRRVVYERSGRLPAAQGLEAPSFQVRGALRAGERGGRQEGLHFRRSNFHLCSQGSDGFRRFFPDTSSHAARAAPVGSTAIAIAARSRRQAARRRAGQRHRWIHTGQTKTDRQPGRPAAMASPFCATPSTRGWRRRRPAGTRPAPSPLGPRPWSPRGTRIL